MLTTYFDSLVDDFGIWQHTDGTRPLESEGYALDDATRGLILCLALGKTKAADVLFDYILRSRHQDGFYGFYSAGHQPLGFPCSEDALGQVAWAMGVAADRGFRDDEARQLVAELRPVVERFKFVRGSAYALTGAAYLDWGWARELATLIAAKVSGQPEDWPWPEESLTYGNAILPYSLLRYEILTGDDSWHGLALRQLEFLEAACHHDGQRGPIGNAGWLERGGRPAVYSQQPIDAAYMVLAWRAAWQIEADPRPADRAADWVSWFEGQNVAGHPLVNPQNNQCYDGIDEAGVNYHSGAESNICYLLVRWAQEVRRTL